MESLPKHAILYMPEGGAKPKAVVQVVHGMAEHQLRYIPLAEFLNKNRIAVITSDLRGHGDNVNRQEELGYFGDNAVAHLIADVHDITDYIRTNFHDIPYILLGHSMGTLISTCYFKKFDNFLNGMILSGMPGKNGATGIAKFLIKLIAQTKGEYYRSPFIDNLCNGPFAKPFANEGSPFAWLSVDKENVKNYEADPKCGYVFTLNGFFTLMELMDGTYKEGSWIMKNKDCPIMLISGKDDPCMGSHNNFLHSVELFKEHGYKNVTYTLYPGQRHEIFNDTGKAVAMGDVVKMIDEIVAAHTAAQ